MNHTEERGGKTAAAETTETPSLPRMIFAHTGGGEDIVARMVDFMRGDVEGALPADQLAAARELMDRAWGKPAASPATASPDADGAEDAGDDHAARKLSEMITAALAADDNGSG